MGNGSESIVVQRRSATLHCLSTERERATSRRLVFFLLRRCCSGGNEFPPGQIPVRPIGIAPAQFAFQVHRSAGRRMNFQHSDRAGRQLMTRDHSDSPFGHILGKRQHTRLTSNMDMHGPGERMSVLGPALSEPRPLRFHKKSIDVCLHVCTLCDRLCWYFGYDGHPDRTGTPPAAGSRSVSVRS